MSKTFKKNKKHKNKSKKSKKNKKIVKMNYKIKKSKKYTVRKINIHKGGTKTAFLGDPNAYVYNPESKHWALDESKMIPTSRIDTEQEETIRNIQERENAKIFTKEANKFKKYFLSNISSLISNLNRNASNKKIKEQINLFKTLFETQPQYINTLIPIDRNGKPIEDSNIDKTTVYDAVSPASVIIDSLYDKNNKVIEILLDLFLDSGGDINLKSSILNKTVLEEQIDKGRNAFSNFLVTKYIKNIDTRALPPEKRELTVIKSTPLPESGLLNLDINNSDSYDIRSEPEFWKTIFSDEQDNLLDLRDRILSIYESDKFEEGKFKETTICKLVKSIIPSYIIKKSLADRETMNEGYNISLLNCLIILLLGIVSYKLYNTNQDYILLFKGGRSVQLSVIDNKMYDEYSSDDTDVLIIPNPSANNVVYNKEKMLNLACHIGFLIKWLIPVELTGLDMKLELPMKSLKNIVKIAYKDQKGTGIKALSDIGFDEIPEEIKEYFLNLEYKPLFVNELDRDALFIIPTMIDILREKLYFYYYYSSLKDNLINGVPITEPNSQNITPETAQYYIDKFKRSVVYILEQIVKNQGIGSEEEKQQFIRSFLHDELSHFHNYTPELAENAINSLLYKETIRKRAFIPKTINGIRVTNEEEFRKALGQKI